MKCLELVMESTKEDANYFTCIYVSKKTTLFHLYKGLEHKLGKVCLNIDAIHVHRVLSKEKKVLDC